MAELELNQQRVEIWKTRFRRKYAGNLAGLKTFSDEIANEAGEVVTITQTNLDGGSGAGVVTGNKMEMLAAAESLIAEWDTAEATSAAAAAPVRVIYPTFASNAFPH